MIQGQSYTTEEKSRGFASVFAQQISVVSNSRVLRRNPYIHVDLHAGSGWNEEVDVIGSPLLWRDLAELQGFSNYLMFAVDNDYARCSSLAGRLADDDRCFPLFGDNAELCAALPDVLREFSIEPKDAIGSILIDPNGFVGQIPYAGLQSLLKTCGRLDVIFNYPGTAYQRAKDHAEYTHIDAVPGLLCKSHWYIREPLPTWKFTLLVGRNTDKLRIPKKLSEKPFALWGSELGQRHRNKASMTTDEYAALPMVGQLELF